MARVQCKGQETVEIVGPLLNTRMRGREGGDRNKYNEAESSIASLNASNYISGGGPRVVGLIAKYNSSPRCRP